MAETSAKGGQRADGTRSRVSVGVSRKFVEAARTERPRWWGGCGVGINCAESSGQEEGGRADMVKGSGCVVGGKDGKRANGQPGEG